ncbi:RHS repeat-associated core domain-containing protein [Micromonospora sp. NPDC049114]|uniref:RHS repeat-associated core domain-containing protein n=1 Tax=Micromonospora sp. NPDC049114 TaxID=3155498 RepID=UPI0033E3EC11
MRTGRYLARWVLGAVSVVAIVAAAGTTVVAPTPAHAASGSPRERSVPGRTVPRVRTTPDPEADAATPLPAPHWPAAGTVDVTLAPGHPVRAGSLPIEVSATGTGDAPAEVRVELLDQESRAALDSVGTAFRLSRRAGGSGRVHLDVDYSRFRYGYGGNLADRLRLVRVPQCVTRECVRTPAPVAARNDLAAGRLSADVDSGPDQVYAVTAAASGTGTGDYRATDLSPAEKWTAGTNSGSFTESYPLRLPPSVGGDAPDLSLDYDSSTVDGRTSSTNNQASWVGLGWNLGIGFIERRYRSCVEDGDAYHADLCWVSPYSGDEDGAAFVLSLDGVSTELIKTADGTYRMRDDRGWKIEHRFNGSNDDNTGEYWVVSTPDGEQHTFGNRKDSNWTVPVVGDDAGEPCHSTAPVPCRQTWRWNLDTVVDANENVTAVYWTPETNNYRQANGGATYRYDRGGHLDRIEYGMLAGQHPSAQVDFTAVGRCTQRIANPTASCPAVSAANATSYPDVPTDLVCADGAGCAKYSPTFFSTSRLDLISAQVWNAQAQTWQETTRWRPTFAFPPTPDGTTPSLWLNSIQQTGLWGGETVTLPPVAFDGIFLGNRQDYTTTAQQLQMRRLSVVRNGLGGETRVSYGHASPATTCPAGGENTGWEAGVLWDQNRYECFRVRFKPEGATNPVKGVFHRYLVTKVDQVDLVGGSPTMSTSYAYGVDQLVPWPAWHRDDELTVAAKDMDWTDWRGYQTVRVTEGSGGADRQSITDTRYFRGMNGDLLGSGSARTEAVKDYTGQPWPDDPQLAGTVLQQQRYRRNADNSLTELESSRSTYWDSGIIADGPGSHDVHMVRPAYEYRRDRRGDGTWRERAKRSDGYSVGNGGLVTREADLGETGVADSVCTEIGYAQNTAAGQWMLDFVERRETHAGDPDGQSLRCPGPVVDRTVTLYDGATGPGDGVNEPTDGNPTEVRSHTADGTYNWVRNTYDDYGRELTETNPDGVTRTGYRPATGFPSDGVSVTDPKGFTATSYPSPAFDDTEDRNVDVNGRTTTSAYDGVGRLRKVWLPTEQQTGTTTPSYEFTYRITATGAEQPSRPTVVTARQLQTLAGTRVEWLTTHTYLDGLGRTREVQAPAPSGSGRTVTVTAYDDRGLTAGTSQPMWNSTAAGDNPDLLLNPATSTVPSWTERQYDALEREALSTVYGLGAATARTTTDNFGNGTIVTPPVGGRTGSWQDAFDRVVQTQQNLPAGVSTPQPGAPTTSYTYTPRGDLASVTDPAGDVSAYTYDWLGQRLTAKDPNAGLTTYTYDGVGRVASATDALRKKVSYSYDALGRRSVTWSGDVQTGTRLAEWTYDTVPGGKGRLAATTRHVGTDRYRTEVASYDDRYRVTGRRWVVPTSEKSLAGTYEITYGYDRADHLTDTTYPAGNGLAQETVHQGYTGTGVADTLASELGTYVSGTAYHEFGPVKSRDYGGAGEVRRSYRYEDRGERRLVGLGATAGADTSTPRTVQSDEYGYDAVGNVRQVADGTTGQAECFGYDGLQRLTDAWTTTAGTCAGGSGSADGGGPDPYRLTYAYDPTGSITSVTSGSESRTYRYPQPGPEAVRPQAVSAVGADTFAYDADGQETSRTVDGVTTTSSYDEGGRLTEQTTAGATTGYVYDADGTRLIRRAPGATTLYLDGVELVLTSSVSATRFYQLGDDLAAMRTSGGVRFLLTDEQGSVQFAVDATTPGATHRVSGDGVSRQRYLPYGAHRGGDTISGTDRGYLGKVEDASTSLVALDNRQHDPLTGRLTSPDPLLNTDNPASQNAYAYADNNPTTLSDPSGLCIPGDCPQRMAGLLRLAASTKNKKQRNRYRQLAYRSERREARIYRRVYQRSDRMSVCWNLKRGCHSLPQRDRQPPRKHWVVARFVHEHRSAFEWTHAIGAAVNVVGSGVAVGCAAFYGCGGVGPAAQRVAQLGATAQAVSGVAMAIDTCSYESRGKCVTESIEAGIDVTSTAMPGLSARAAYRFYDLRTRP